MVLNAYIAALPLRGPKSNRKHGKSTTHMITRREVVHGLCSASATAWLAAQVGINFSIVPIAAAAAKDDSAPPLAPVAPMSRKRMVLIDAFTKQSEGVQNRFEARTLNRDRAMPYRLFRPQASWNAAAGGLSPRQRWTGRRQSKAARPRQYLVRAFGCSRRTKKLFPAMFSLHSPTADGSAMIRRRWKEVSSRWSKVPDKVC